MAADAKKKRAGRPPKNAAPEKPEKSVKLDKSGAPKNDSNQFWSIILFAFGILIALMTLVKGSAGWLGIHNFLLGMFGAAVFFVPVILIYTSVQIGMEKSQRNVAGRAIWGIAMTFLASAAFQIFIVGKIPGHRFLAHFGALYEDGVELHGGGVASIVIAGPLLAAFGGLGARIIAVILFFVFGMLLSGLGLIDFLKLLTRPFTFASDCLEGFVNILTGKEFDEAFEDDYDDEEDYLPEEEYAPIPPMPAPIPDEIAEMQSYEDMEAINMVNHKTIPEPPPVIHNSQPMIDGGMVDGFLMDVPLPADGEGDELPAGKGIVGSYTGQTILTSSDEQLEELISKAANKNYDDENGEIIDIDPDTLEAEGEQQEFVLEPLYILPPLDLLSLPRNSSNSTDAAREMREKADTIVNTLRSFGVEVRIRDIFRGPSITRYEVQPGTGVKIAKIKSLDADIALSLAASGVRIAPVPGKPVVGIEVPNGHRDTVSLREILSCSDFQNASGKLTFAVGKDIAGNCVLGDISKMPHVIIAGTTGSGKSVCTRSIIMSILFNAKPSEVKLILIDPKMVEFKVFDGIPHLLTPIIIEAKKAPGALNWAVQEMLRRYKMFAESGANDLKSYNEYAEENNLDHVPQIVIFIDELADMMLVAKNEVEDSIQRLAQMGRAAGMHLVVATQRPTTDVITGTIKANIPSRIALSVMSATDSRTIIDDGGADKLLGNGDMLYKPIGVNDPMRVQGCFASNSEIQATIEYIKAQGEAEYDHSVTEAVESYVPQTKGGDKSDGGDSNISDEDEEILFRAMEIAVMNGQVSTTMLQKKLKLGYAKASRFIDELEERGVIGPSEGSKPRKVYMSRMQFDEMKLRRMQDID